MHMDVAGRDIDFHELTVRQIRDWLAMSRICAEQDAISLALFPDLPTVADLPVFCSLTRADLDDMTPLDIDSVRSLVREINSKFFDVDHDGMSINGDPLDALESAIVEAVELGHVAVLDYPWSLFLVAMKKGRKH